VQQVRGAAGTDLVPDHAGVDLSDQPMIHHRQPAHLHLHSTQQTHQPQRVHPRQIGHEQTVHRSAQHLHRVGVGVHRSRLLQMFE